MTTQAGLLNVLGALYASVLFFAVINALTVQPVLSAERAVSYRERAAGMYSFWPWTLALVSTLQPAESVCTCITAYHLHSALSQCEVISHRVQKDQVFYTEYGNYDIIQSPFAHCVYAR